MIEEESQFPDFKIYEERWKQQLAELYKEDEKMSEDEYGIRIFKTLLLFFLVFWSIYLFFNYKLTELEVKFIKSKTTGEYSMTKKQLLDSLKDLSDDAEIHVEAVSDDFDIDHTADFVEVKDIVSGSGVQNKANNG